MTQKFVILLLGFGDFNVRSSVHKYMRLQPTYSDCDRTRLVYFKIMVAVPFGEE